MRVDNLCRGGRFAGDISFRDTAWLRGEFGYRVNHLEQLVAEWYEYRGYFVRRNVWVGKRAKGGWECELDVVAFDPKKKHLVQIEPSMDADSWQKRIERYTKKFTAGRKYIPELFEGVQLPSKIEQIALFGLGRTHGRETIAGGRVMSAGELYKDIISELVKHRVASAAVPEQYPLLRTIQFCCEHRKAVGW